MYMLIYQGEVANHIRNLLRVEFIDKDFSFGAIESLASLLIKYVDTYIYER